jgi:hypothetical protein
VRLTSDEVLIRCRNYETTFRISTVEVVEEERCIWTTCDEQTTLRRACEDGLNAIHQCGVVGFQPTARNLLVRDPHCCKGDCVTWQDRSSVRERLWKLSSSTLPSPISRKILKRVTSNIFGRATSAIWASFLSK